MKEPIIVYDSGDLDVFESVEKTEAYIEPIDVKIGDSIFFDSEGKILHANVVEDSRGIERTVIVESGLEKFDKPELRKILINFLKYLNYPKSELEEMELSSLVRESLKFKTE